MIRPARGYRYPLWNTRAIVLISVPVLVTITILVFVLSNRSMFVETELTLLVISICLFAFLTTGLYRGVRLQRPSPKEFDSSIVEFESKSGAKHPIKSEFWNALSFIPIPDIHFDAPKFDLHDLPDGGDDLVGCLFSIVLWVVVLLLVAVLFWVLGQVIAALPVIILALTWIFYRALRIVFAKSRACKGRLLQSMGYALLYTFLYVGWIAAVLWLGRLVITGALLLL